MSAKRMLINAGITICLAGSTLCSVTQAAEQSIEIHFGAAFGDQDFLCGQSYAGIGTTSSTVEPLDFRFFVHEVALIDGDGNTVPLTLTQDGIWQYQNLVLLDFEDGTGPCLNGNSAMNSSIKGSVPAGNYQGIEFVLGVPYDLNHNDVTLNPSPLNLSAMFWNWRGGHRFLKVDMSTSGRPVAPSASAAPPRMIGAQAGAMTTTATTSGAMNSDEEAPGFLVHLGSTGCTSESRTTAPDMQCANPNLVSVRFDQFDIAQQRVVADMKALLANTNVDVNTPETAPGCMSAPDDPECAGILPGLGLQGGSQQLFRVE